MAEIEAHDRRFWKFTCFTCKHILATATEYRAVLILEGADYGLRIAFTPQEAQEIIKNFSPTIP